MRALLCSAVLVVLAAGSASAQVCMGHAPFTDGNLRVGGAALFTDGAQGFGGAFAGGGAGVFGEASLTRVSYDDVDGSTFVVGGAGGYQLPLSTAQNIQVCPVVSLGLGFGPNDIEGSGVDMSTQSYTIGVAIGTVIQSSPQLQIVPAGGLAFASTKIKFKGGGGSISESDTYGMATAGLGFVINRVLTLQPNVAFPFGLDESDPTFGIVVAFQFGRR